ncbi:permease [Streptomyces sp. GSL17-111]|uniref:permease n=1 Tax=Streptomyces sp. GSL17-111 TaxID=3121596 RepID=UPI0030F4250E
MNNWGETFQTFGIIAAELVALFLAISFLVALFNRRVGPKRIQSWLGGGSVVGPLKGVALGALTPFCSCSTLPMLAGMFKAGVPFVTAASFLVASPLLNPIILTAVAVLFSVPVMLGYAAVALVGSLLIAAGWNALGLGRFVKRVRVEGEKAEEPWQGLRAEMPGAWRSARSDFRPLVIPLLVGVSVGALIYGAVPESFLTGFAGPDNPAAIPVAAVIGIPLYIRTEAALPIGLALSEAGMGIGAVFALIIGGAGASIPEVSMLTAIFKPRLVAAFVASILVMAVAGGFIIPLFA